MGRTVALDAAGTEVARRAFRRYYAEHPPSPPPRLARREFATFSFEAPTVMHRHTALPTAEAFGGFFRREETPRHVYYSSAYYERPAHARMAEKEWRGADLIFDLDADHLRHAEGLDYPSQLRLVKERFRALLDEFLFGDFGIDPASTTLVFSGGRGYHAHVREEGYLGLSSIERRELVEYVLGSEVDPAAAVRSEGVGPSPVPADRPLGGRHRPPASFQRLADPTEGGWPGRISRSFLLLLDRWAAEGVAAAAEEIEGWGFPPRKARQIAKALLDADRGRSIREGLTLEVFDGPVPEGFLRAALDRARIEVQGETDAPVTTDIHRLIRLPGSLHGGTGLRVLPISRDALEAFEPLRDAVAPGTGSDPIRVTASATVRYPFGDGILEARAGETVELAPSAAVFLLLRGEATVTPPGAPS
ncbi:MAG: DNA primase small subunit domain-containing protein [Thermoplasmata archaeon]